MKLFVVLVALMASCSSLPSQRNKATTPTARKELHLNIPKDNWEPIFFTAIDERASLSNLKTLRAEPLPGEDLEGRVWHGFGVTLLEGFVLKRTAGQWSAIHLDGVMRSVTAAESDKQLQEPKSGWDACLQRLEQAGILTLPDAAAIGCNAMITDGMRYVVEFNRGGVYRTYMYPIPTTQSATKRSG
jgi:hypothetical protein